MAPKTKLILMPQDLTDQIDALVGPESRSTFVIETARAELRKRALLVFLESGEAVWKDEDHPQLAAMGTQACLKMMRAPGEERLRRLHDRMNQPNGTFDGK